MTFDLLLAFVAFGFVTAVTPGPNNVMLLASGVNFGFLRSVPHILGTAFGMVVMIAGVGVGLGGLFRAYPVLYGVLRWVGAACLLYLAHRGERGAQGRRHRGPTDGLFGRRRVPVGEP